MHDSYGDGWHGNSLVISRIKEGYSEVLHRFMGPNKGQLVEDIIINIPSDGEYEVKVHDSYYSEEVSWTISQQSTFPPTDAPTVAVIPTSEPTTSLYSFEIEGSFMYLGIFSLKRGRYSIEMGDEDGKGWSGSQLKISHIEPNGDKKVVHTFTGPDGGELVVPFNIPSDGEYEVKLGEMFEDYYFELNVGHPTWKITFLGTFTPTDAPTAAGIPTTGPTDSPTTSPTIPPPTSSPSTSPTTSPTVFCWIRQVDGVGLAQATLQPTISPTMMPTTAGLCTNTADVYVVDPNDWLNTCTMFSLSTESMNPGWESHLLRYFPKGEYTLYMRGHHPDSWTDITIDIVIYKFIPSSFSTVQESIHAVFPHPGPHAVLDDYYILGMGGTEEWLRQTFTIEEDLRDVKVKISESGNWHDEISWILNYAPLPV